MQKTWLALAFGAFSLIVSPAAKAQELGSKGDAIFGAERLFGIRGERAYLDNPDPQDDYDLSGTTISFGFARADITPYNIPRVSFDYLVIDKLSIGGALGYSSVDEDVEDGGSPSITDFLFAPRVGYLHMFGSVVGIWPRGGFMYHSTARNDAYSQWTLALNAECMFPIVIAPHFGVLVGLSFDQALTGNHDPENGPERDVSFRSFGVQVGLFGWI